MLLEFKFKNYRSFYEEAILDFNATTERSHEHHLYEKNARKVLLSIALHGNNASGKTNTLNAFLAMKNLVLYSLFDDIKQEMNVDSFCFEKQALREPTVFEVKIIHEQNEYQYGFAIWQGHISEEWLYQKKLSVNKTIQKLIYKREFNQLITTNNKLKEYFKLIDDSVLLLSFLGKRNIEPASFIYHFFDNTYFFSDKIISKQKYNVKVGSILLNNPHIKKEMEKLLNYIDPSLKGFRITKKDTALLDYDIYGVHNTGSKEPISLELDRESLGTIKFIRIVPFIFEALLNGGVVVIDELDTKFHPLVYRKIVSLFYDSNINVGHAQLLFSTHSTFLLNSTDMRRDQLYLTNKEADGKSQLYSLSDYDKLRLDSNYEKKYLSGDFGAIPFLHKN